MSARTLLGWFVATFGAVCVAIGFAHIALGPRAIPGGLVTNATMDSEDRFYATLFAGFGAAVIWASRDLIVRREVLKALLLVFFAGGVARIVSWTMAGPPVPVFWLLGGLELMLPPAIWLAMRRWVSPD